MKHLYKIDVEHSAPKDTNLAIAGYIVANSEEEVYEYLASDSYIDNENPFSIFTGWKNKEVDDENFKQKMLKVGGELGDDDREYENLYYGLTYYGWTDYGEVTDEEIKILKKVLLKDIVLLG